MFVGSSLKVGLGFSIMAAVAATCVAVGCWIVVREAGKMKSPIEQRLQQHVNSEDGGLYMLLGVFLAAAGLVIALLTIVSLALST
jgi:protein-disulfide isomerase